MGEPQIGEILREMGVTIPFEMTSLMRKDSLDLTDADRRAYADYAKAQRHKGFQRVRVSFRDRPRQDEDA